MYNGWAGGSAPTYNAPASASDRVTDNDAQSVSHTRLHAPSTSPGASSIPRGCVACAESHVEPPLCVLNLEASVRKPVWHMDFECCPFFLCAEPLMCSLGVRHLGRATCEHPHRLLLRPPHASHIVTVVSALCLSWPRALLSFPNPVSVESRRFVACDMGPDLMGCRLATGHRRWLQCA